MRPTFLLAVVACASAACASRAQSAGCPGEGRGVEAAVCRSRELHRLDRRLSARYAALLPRLGEAEADALRDDQRQWVRERDDWCSSQGQAPGALEQCLAGAYRDRLDDLDRLDRCRAAGSRDRPGVCRLLGEWRVSAVRAGAGVQAVQRDDSLYLNKVLRGDQTSLEFGAERCDLVTVERTLRSTRRWFEEWYGARPSALSWEDRPLARSLVVRPRCRSGVFGPAAAGGSQIIIGRGDEIGLTYYDGAFLILRPSR